MAVKHINDGVGCDSLFRRPCEVRRVEHVEWQNHGVAVCDRRPSKLLPLRAINDRIGWDQLERSVQDAEELTRSADDGLDEVVERYPAVRKFAPTFLAAFAFHAARPGDPLLGAVEALRRMYRDGRSVLPKRVPTTFLRPR